MPDARTKLCDGRRHLVLQMLSLGRRLRELVDITDKAGDWGLPPKRCSEDYFAFNWSARSDIRGLWKNTVGILGFGEIGTELARRLKGFGCQVLYSKRRPLPPAVEAELNLVHVSRDELARRSDFIACLLPNLPENNQIIDDRFFAQMKKGALFAHSGAPGVVNEDALIAALRAHQVGGAAIDCFTYEPLRGDDPLVELARDPRCNVILTPHVGAGTVAANSAERVGDFYNLLAIINNRELRYRVV